jgi:hypothetical protein
MCHMQANVNLNPGGSMKKASHELEKEDTDQVWSVEGNFRHPVYSPRGGIEGVVIDADGIPAQFAFEPGNEATSAFAGMKQGERLILEGTEAGAPPKGEAAHAVYQFVRIAGIGGVAQEPEGPGEVEAPSCASITPVTASRTASCSTAATLSMFGQTILPGSTSKWDSGLPPPGICDRWRTVGAGSLTPPRSTASRSAMRPSPSSAGIAREGRRPNASHLTAASQS